MLFQTLGMQDTIFSPLLKEVIGKTISLLSPHLHRYLYLFLSYS